MYLAYTGFGALSLQEGTSFLRGRLGQQIVDPRISVWDDAHNPLGLPASFDFEGVPKQRVELVVDGVARDVVWDRRTGARAGKRSTGHALAPPAQAQGPIPLNLAVPGGDMEPGELVERVGDGIYVSRLHYLSVVDPREAIFTGMTRDGTFRIEDGRVTRPLVNLRFTSSFPELAERLLGLSRERKLVNQSDFYGDRYPYGTLVPAVATERFTIAGTGSRPGL